MLSSKKCLNVFINVHFQQTFLLPHNTCYYKMPFTCQKSDFIVTFGPRSDKRDLMAIKVKSKIFTEKESQDIVNNY